MSRTRTPEHFPRMKVRGGRRRRDAEITRAWRTVSKVDWSGLTAAFDGFANGIARAVDSIVTSVQRIAQAAIASANVTWWIAGQNARNRWVATHQLPATVSPWAAPVQCTERGKVCLACDAFVYSKSCRRCGGTWIEPTL